jgi:hypothetical protein
MLKRGKCERKRKVEGKIENKGAQYRVGVQR